MGPVVVAAVLQYLLAALFLIIPVVAYRHGTSAQRAAEADVERQGFAVSVLARHQVRFAESGVETFFPFGIAVVLAALASMNLAGVELGRIVSWVLHPVLLVGGGLTTAGQVFPTRYVEAAFRKSGDPAVRGIDVGAFIDAANDAFPRWLRPAIVARFLLVTVGSVLVIVLVSLPPATAHYR